MSTASYGIQILLQTKKLKTTALENIISLTTVRASTKRLVASPPYRLLRPGMADVNENSQIKLLIASAGNKYHLQKRWKLKFQTANTKLVKTLIKHHIATSLVFHIPFIKTNPPHFEYPEV